MNKLCLIPLLAATSIQAWGAAVTSNSLFFNFNGSKVLAFDQFDPTLGSLTKVEMLFQLGSRTEMSGFPNGPAAAGCEGTYSYARSVDAGGVVTGLGSFSGTLTSATCSGQDVDIHSFSPPYTISNASNLSLFEGTGTVDVTIARGAFSVTNITNARLLFDGTAQLRYTYDPAPVVPEPGTSALLGCCLLAGVVARRLGISRRIS